MKIERPKKPKNTIKRLRSIANNLFKEKIIELANERCEVCGSSFGITAHHFVPRSLALHMVYLLENGVCLCRGCHFAHHTKSDPKIHATIIEKRGKEWYENLMEIRKEQHHSYLNKKYYLDKIEELK